MISDIQKHYTIQELAHLDNKFLSPAEQAFFMEKQEDALIAYYDQLEPEYVQICKQKNQHRIFRESVLVCFLSFLVIFETLKKIPAGWESQ